MGTLLIAQGVMLCEKAPAVIRWKVIVPIKSRVFGLPPAG
ncbi:hypothetical protein FBZ98_1293 [Rhizobium sp. ERR 922]|nr:hypothetical protein FBZ98_1293 [Rhizobium sp. ERR 922]TWB87182.1 hypothetical protein FBZ97_1262 [Rhizobium sp. ERR 942]